MKKDKSTTYSNINIRNKKARFEYVLLDKYVAGLVLTGTEIKSIREGKVSIGEGYCIFIKDELFARQIHISPYKQGGFINHEPIRERKLLLKKKELKKILKKNQVKGLTIVPLRLFINDKGLAKLEIALAKGKQMHDKRETIREKDMKRDMERINH
jgi:SsrA-binding protein